MGDCRSCSGLAFGDAAWNIKDDGSIAMFHGRVFSMTSSCAREGSIEEPTWRSNCLD